MDEVEDVGSEGFSDAMIGESALPFVEVGVRGG
jgi:hypothetical protein